MRREPSAEADAYLFNEATGMTKPMRYRTAKADVYGHVAELLAKATDKGALDGELTADNADNADNQERLIDVRPVALPDTVPSPVRMKSL